MSSVAQKKSFGAQVWDFLTTVDHKKIAILYLAAGTLFFAIAGLEALFMRFQLMFPESTFMSAGTFNELLTMHGTTMLFLAATPLLFAFMNAIVPLQIGARDVAFPFLNSLGFWLFFLGAVFLHLSFFLGGAPDAGWTSYASLSLYSPGHGIDFYILGLQISGAGTLISGINFIVTIITMRAPGMTFMRMPLFTWTTLVSSTLILFAFPPLTVSLFLLLVDRMFGANFFDHLMGGNTIIWEHLFWIFGHPEVYILVLPAFGLFSEIIPVFARKRLFGYSSMVFATILIGFLGFMVWAHHMFTVGLGATANAIFAVATMTIAVPTGMKVFNWILTIWGGSIKVTVPMLYALGFIPSFVAGGVTGVMMAAAPLDYQLHDSYFIVAHFHYVIVGGIVTALFGAAHFYWPIMFNRVLSEKLGVITFWIFFIGFHLTFFLQHFLGLMGMPRRVFTFMPNQGWDLFNLISTIGAIMMGIGVILLVLNVLLSIKSEPVNRRDYWGDGRSLEWALETPLPFYNFKQTPLVRGYDPYWIEKHEGNKEGMVYAEPLGDIHMPNNSILPLVMSIGMFIAGFGALYSPWGDQVIAGTAKGISPALSVGLLIFGIGMTVVAMITRSAKDDLGYYVTKAEVEATEKDLAHYRATGKKGGNK
ncbi:cytochrome c oxidase subunit I [Metasolibacillus sp. FSL H7-0170]|uniref:cytochrome c oxidase subunit I n=1 Tax=Metasolibacillus TaxID=2703677 RepID=UPI0007912F8D|nr:cytochrome c oxidase subunit I [Metasolibacillus fluoroglycofenilyticus]KYG89382.1 cytochrome ubiquinol oxidase subunit I [[Bacillus] sp. KCTC 13219]